MRIRRDLTLAALISLAALVAQQPQPKPASYVPTADERRQIEARCAELRGLVASLQGNPLYADAAIYLKAGEFILKYPEEFANPGYVADTMAALDHGIARAKELAAGSPSWIRQKGRLVRAFVSSIDGSVQPYGLLIPDSYSGRPVRLDVWLHGMNRNLNEVAFIKQHESAIPLPAGQNYIQLDVYGRSNVSYRWAGETDVFEAIRAVEAQYRIDTSRIALRGFSMGGAGAWHLGLHYPDQWAAFEAGAGYTETKLYAKKGPMPPYQEAALHYYDAMDYALNGVNVPFIGYGGELDPQLQASKNIQAQLLKEGVKLSDLQALFLVGPGVAHRWNPQTHEISDRFIDAAVAKGIQTPAHIRFVTYTTRFNRCHWVTAEELDEHYQRAEIDARRTAGGVTATTRNVARIRIEGAGPVTLDAQKFPQAGMFQKASGKWAKAGPLEPLRKRHGLQGPIDDAFVDSFLCVRPTGDGTGTTEYGLRVLAQFEHDFSKWLRGDPRVKEDRAVTASDIANSNLILFGDPWSNELIAKIIGKLPLKWTRSEITLAGRTVDAATHAPVLIYPNPLNPKRYIVINSGHTFSDSDWRGTNANLYPHLGDYALVHLPDGEIVHSGFFDERWK